MEFAQVRVNCKFECARSRSTWSLEFLILRALFKVSTYCSFSFSPNSSDIPPAGLRPPSNDLLLSTSTISTITTSTITTSTITTLTITTSTVTNH